MIKLPVKFLIEECVDNFQYSDNKALDTKWISEIRILGMDEHLKQDVLYVALDSCYIPEDCKTKGIVILSKPMDKLPKEFLWVSVLENCNLLKLMADMQNLFQKFREWYTRLYDACAFGCNLQEILDISEEMTQNCIYIADMSFKILAYTNKEIMMEISATWRYQMAHGYLPVHVMKGMIETGEFEELNGFRMAAHFFSRNFNVPFLTKNIFFNNKPQAHLFIINSQKRPSYRDIAIGQLLGEFIEQHYFLMSEFKLNRISSNYEAFFTDVLNGTCTDEMILQKQISLFDWNLSDSYCMGVADIRNRDTGFLRIIMYQIESQTDLKCFVYESSLIVLERVKKEKTETLKMILSDISHRYSLEICMGNVFSQFVNLKLQYQIIMKIMRIAGLLGVHSGFYRLTDYSLYYLIDHWLDTVEIYQLCSEDAHVLREFDRQNSTDYFKTYLSYLLNDRNVVQTSKNLHIHRNTLMYRLEKIQQLISVDEEESAQKIFMLLSMLLLDYQEMIMN